MIAARSVLPCLLLSLAACASRGDAKKDVPSQEVRDVSSHDDPSPATGDDLARRLDAAGYERLFGPSAGGELDAIWSASGGGKQLLALVRGGDPWIRFLAAEALFHKDPSFPPADVKPALAEAYATALARTAKVGGPVPNRWGYIFEDGDIGEIGPHVLAIGEPAVAALRPLLADTTLLSYEGSEEATLAAMHRIRTRDVAAFYIARIRKLPFTVARDPAARDRDIAAIQAALAKAP